MDVRSPFFQNLACILAGVMFLNPIVSVAADLTVDAAAGGNTSIGAAGNGVPVVNIATPNGSGLSHNRFTDYNVGQQGLILNNSTSPIQSTQLGGYILGNGNLNGRAATVILNEVTGSNRSELKGYTEVAGQGAHVIVANPHGITCDGCGFINTPKATLTTGAPVIENGVLKQYDVNGGEIVVEGQGLNASNVDQFELITRSAKINAELHANKLTVVAGRNDVDAADLSATAKADDGSAKPQLAIDSSALGGMYAGAIRLVGTEQGVGVKLAGDMAASAGDIQIDANGRLSMARTAAAQDVKIAAQSVELNADTFAGRNAEIQSTGTVEVKDSLAAGNRVQVEAATLNNAGIVEAGVRADGTFNGAGNLQLNGGQVNNSGNLVSHGSLNTDVQTLNNQNGTLTAAADATLKADTLNNRNGQAVAQGNLKVEVRATDNRGGDLLAGRNLDVKGTSLNNQGGTVAANGVIKTELTGALSNDTGLVEAGTALDVQAGSVSNASGKLRALGSAGESRFAIGGRFDNGTGLVEIGNALFSLTSASLSNQGGTVRHVGNQGFALALEEAGEAGGSFITNGELNLDVDEWSNSSLLQAQRITLDVDRFTQTSTGQLLSASDIVIRGGDWLNDGKIVADGLIDFSLTGAYTGNGQLIAQQGLTFVAASTDLGANSRINAGDNAELAVTGTLASAGVITADGALAVRAASLDNRGTLGSGGMLNVTAASMVNTGGLIFSGASMLLTGQRFTNLRGDLYGLGSISFVSDGNGGRPLLFSNLSGTVESESDITLSADQIVNAHEVENLIVSRKVSALFYGRDCTDCSGDKENVRYRLREIDRTEAISNVRTSSLLAGGNLTLNAQDINNRYSLMAANGGVLINANTFNSIGAETGEVVTERRARSPRMHSTSGLDQAVANFNARYSSPSGTDVSAALNSILGNFEAIEFFSATTTPDATQNYSAIVQAGTDVQINAQQIGNASIRPSFSYVSSGTRVDTGAPGTGISTQVTLNAQLPPDLQQKVVDPLTQPGFNLPTGQNGLFSLNLNADHPYLIETNAAFASLKNFLNSDYILGLLGYDLNTVQRRLGDGFYEQRLIREAVIARTGQRYLAGLNSDEAQFKYLMDNAIASKDALNLSVGVALSAEQVAALTHDIVWMEEREVNGQKVLAPVLYLAQAEGRLAPGGALIQGRDVTLISGGDLSNSGTLRATRNLELTAQKDITNSGLMHANERVSLLAGDSIRNTQGGILKGKDVSLVAMTGDVVNERSVSTHQSLTRNSDRQQSFVDSAARIEASNDLLVSAGNDIQNIGGAISVGRNATLEAGNDLVIGSAAAESHQNLKDREGYSNQSTVTQYGSDVQIGGNLEASAGRDLLIVGSKVKAGGDIDLDAAGDVSIISAANQSSLDYLHKGGGKKVVAQEQHVQQVASVIEAGGDFTSTSGNDTTLIASHIAAGEEAYVYAAGDLNLDVAENLDYSYFYKKSKGGLFSSSKLKMSETSNTEAVGASITSGSNLVLIADKNITARGAQLASEQNVYLSAGQDVILDAAQNTHSEANAKAKSNLVSSKAKTSDSTITTVSSTLIDGQNVSVQADNDIALRAAGLRADNALVLDAGRDVSVGTSLQSQQSSQASKSRTLQWHIFDSLATNGSLTLEQKAKSSQMNSVQEVGSTLSGGSIAIQSGRDAEVRGSTVVADDDVRIAAARDLSIVSGQSRDDSNAKSSSKKSGEVGTWYNGATGVVGLKESSESHSVQQIGSQVASLEGNVVLSAGEHYQQTASQLVAPKGDISITAKRVDIEAGYDTVHEAYKQSSSRTALGGSVSIPLVDAIQSGKRMVDASKDVSDSRLTALAAVNTAMSAQQAYDGAQALAAKDFTGIKVSVNLSNSKSQSHGSQSGQNVVGSSVAAGGDVIIKAVGNGQNSNLNVVGSSVNAEHDIIFNADGTINLLGAKNTAVTDGKNSNSGWSVGVGFALFGDQNGFTLELAANKGKGFSKGDAVTYTNTVVSAGNQVSINSGADTNLKGAVVNATQVKADVGGDFNLVSLQDIDDYKSKQQNASVGLSLCIPPFCYGVPSTGTAAFGQQKINSEYASVGQQTGIKAGDGGFQINVAGNTDLQGAAIASTDKAVADHKNSLTTGTLTHSDIRNKAEYKASSISLSATYSGEAYDKNGNVRKGEDGKPLYDSGVSAGTPIALNASDKDKSTTYSGISGGVITITDGDKQKQLTNETAEEAVAGVNRDVSSEKDGSNTLGKIFDRKEIEAGFEITEQFVRNVGTFLDKRAKESTEAKRDLAAELDKPEGERNTDRINYLKDFIAENKTWEVGGTGRTLVSVLSGAAGGNVTGGTSQFLQSAAVNYLQGLATEKVKLIADDLDSETARAALHAIVGCVGAAAQSQSCSSGALGASSSVVLNNLLDKLKDETASGMTDAEKQNRLNLIGSLVAGITAVAGGDAAVASNAALIESENNHLDVYEKIDLHNKKREYANNCEGSSSRSCENLKADIEELEEKGRSILAKDFQILGEDMGKSYTVETSPGDIVPCESSANGFCVVTNEGIDRGYGKEWMLIGVSDAEAALAQTQRKEKLAEINQSLKEKGIELYEVGCGALTLCLAYKVVGGENLITGEVASNEDRILSAIGLAVVAAGLANGVKISGSKGAVTGKAALPAGYREGPLTSVGVAEAAELPAGYRRVINTKTGNTEVLAADGSLYFETANGLKLKEVGNAVPVGSSGYVQSATIQKNTTVQLSENVTLANGQTVPKGSVVTVSDDTIKITLPDGSSKMGSYSKITTPPAGLPGPKEIPKELGKVSFDAANGVGTIYSPRVTMSGSEITFDEFAIGTSKGFIGVGADGAAELAGPLKKMLAYAQSQGAEKITLTGRYASPEGSKLGTGSFDNVNQNFSFSFPATKEGLRDFLKGVGQ